MFFTPPPNAKKPLDLLDIAGAEVQYESFTAPAESPFSITPLRAKAELIALYRTNRDEFIIREFSKVLGCGARAGVFTYRHLNRLRTLVENSISFTHEGYALNASNCMCPGLHEIEALEADYSSLEAYRM